MIFGQRQTHIDLQLAVAQSQQEQARKITTIAKGMIKAQRDDKENYMPGDANYGNKKQIKKRKNLKKGNQK